MIHLNSAWSFAESERQHLSLVIAVKGKELDPFYSLEHEDDGEDELLSTEKVLWSGTCKPEP